MSQRAVGVGFISGKFVCTAVYDDEMQAIAWADGFRAGVSRGLSQLMTPVHYAAFVLPNDERLMREVDLPTEEVQKAIDRAKELLT